jgi:Tol biopolymer transport system component
MIGKSLLHYEIKDSIGKGGMGEVFRARDTKLGRDVALKILPKELSGDPERESRFQREARALASLQHPNVASVYGFEEAEGTRFLVMELISGSELTDRMGKGPIPVEETLVIARQVAAGLEAAHENGIVHRDLKPANIMETVDGEMKILDFGLAQAWFGDDGANQESATSPTMTQAMTQAGAILGTAAYMSPEQARGVNVDRRTDIWAFGVILFEMLTGKQLFKGETISDTLAAVLRKEPEWDALPVEEAPELCRLIERCLERNPKQRLRDIGEARIFLQDGGASGTNLSFSGLSAIAAPAEQAPAKTPVLLLVGLALVGLVGGTFLGWKILAQPEPAPVVHAMIPPPGQTEYQLNGTAPGPAAVSPDGTKVAFSAVDDEGVTLLYLRHLDKGESVALSGTENSAYPFWSPDNNYIGFFVPSDQKLKKVAVGGGPPVTLCTANNGKGGSWNAEGDIIYAATATSGIFKVRDIGGEPVQITNPESGYDSHRHPRFLPGGREFIFVARHSAGSEDNDIFLAALDTSVTPRIITQSQTNAEYVLGHVLSVREDVLMATPFTPDQPKILEGGTPIVEDVLSIMGAAVGVFSPSEDGVLIFQTGASTRAGRLVLWTDLVTGAVQSLGEPGQLFHPSISPDGTQAVVQVMEASTEGTDLWLVDLNTGLRTRFTFAPGDEDYACWSPDGKSVYYRSESEGLNRIMEQPVEGQGGAAILLESENNMAPWSVSPRDNTLLLDFQTEGGDGEIRVLPLDGSGEATTLIGAEGKNMGGGVYSPDGRWIAYHHESASGWDVFVAPAEAGPRKWQVTSEGTAYPKWNSDGTELWASRFNGDLIVYEVDGSGSTFKVGPSSIRATVSSPDATGSFYDLHPDGIRLLHTGIDPAFQNEVSYLHLVTDWKRGLVQ